MKCEEFYSHPGHEIFSIDSYCRVGKIEGSKLIWQKYKIWNKNVGTWKYHKVLQLHVYLE